MYLFIFFHFSPPCATAAAAAEEPFLVAGVVGGRAAGVDAFSSWWCCAQVGTEKGGVGGQGRDSEVVQRSVANTVGGAYRAPGSQPKR